MENKKKAVVILGAGFAGLRAAFDLAKTLPRHDSGYEIILVDKSDTHLYTPDLYEIATAYYPTITSTCLTQLKETVATKISSLIAGKPVTFLRDEVVKIFPEKSVALLKNSEIHYDYLVVALGSAANYYEIPGLRQFSYPLKTISDALAIQCHLDSYFQTLWRKQIKKSVHLVVGGGGATGVELACELPSYAKKLCVKYGYPHEDVHILVVDGKQELVGVGAEVSAKVLERLKKFGVETRLGHYITEAHAASICIKGKSGKIFEIPCDMLVWSGGITPNPVLRESFPSLSEKGALEVSETLETKYPNVFAAGDSSFFMNSAIGRPLPPLAQAALEEGKVIAKNIMAKILGKPFERYRPKLRGIIIPAGGKYAIFKTSGKVYSGFWCWALRRLVDLWYAFSIMPFSQALQKWWHATNIFAKND